VAWLSRLSFVQALRWALLWPAAILTAAAGAWVAAWVRGGNVTVTVKPAGALALWLDLALVVSIAFLGPPVVFLAAWKLARR
jgi:hypothetical protein